MTTPTPEQLAKSQKAFHAFFEDWGDIRGRKVAFRQDDDNYTEEVTIKMFADWQAAEAYGRKVALEEAVSMFCHPEVLSSFSALFTVEQKIKELLR